MSTPKPNEVVGHANQFRLGAIHTLNKLGLKRAFMITSAAMALSMANAAANPADRAAYLAFHGAMTASHGADVAATNAPSSNRPAFRTSGYKPKGYTR